MPFSFNHILRCICCKCYLVPLENISLTQGRLKAATFRPMLGVNGRKGLLYLQWYGTLVYTVTSEGLPCFVASDTKPRDYTLQIIRMMMKHCTPLKNDFLCNVHVVEIQIKTFNAASLILFLSPPVSLFLSNKATIWKVKEINYRNILENIKVDKMRLCIKISFDSDTHRISSHAGLNK